jgi:Flp pilus assembly protein TadG
MRLMPNSFRHFIQDARGNMSVDMAIILPILVWALVGFFSFWDIYRINYLSKKATFVVADIISRERGQVSNPFIFRYGTVFAYAIERPIPLTTANAATQPIAMRVTSLAFSESPSGNATTVLWSMSSDTTRMPLRTTGELSDISARIPAMLDGDNIIVVETRVYWSPTFYQAFRGTAPTLESLSALQTRTIDTLTTVRPRFVPRMCFVATGLTIPCEL